MQYTIAMSLGAVKMFCKGATFKSIKEEYAIFDAARWVRMGVSELVKKYKLEVQRDTESALGFVLVKEDRDTLYELADNEITIIKHPQQRHLDDLIDTPFLVTEIDSLYEERQSLMKAFEAVNSRVLRIERYIKNKNKQICKGN